MNLELSLDKLSDPEMKALRVYQTRHGARVRAATAMKLLDVPSKRTFQKIVDANPELAHRLPGEGQPRYLTAAIFLLLPASARCATKGEEQC